MSGDHDKICSICWEDVANPSVTLKCGHRFHFGCLTEWAKRSNECPMCREQFTPTATPRHEGEEEGDPALDLSMYWQYYDEEAIPHGYQLVAQSLIALSTAITVIRFLALFFPTFVHRLFRTQIEAGKHLQTYFNVLKRWLRPYLSTLCLGFVIFSTPHARNFLRTGGE